MPVVAATMATMNIGRCSCQYLQVLRNLKLKIGALHFRERRERVHILDAICCSQRVPIARDKIEADDCEMQGSAQGPQREWQDAAHDAV